ncbi:MAG: hypothetical protein RJA35_7 [Actinomycetota bacterium]
MANNSRFVDPRFRFSGWTRSLRNASAIGSVAAIISSLFTFGLARQAAGLDSYAQLDTVTLVGTFFTGFYAFTNIWFLVALMGFGLRSAQYVRDAGVALRIKPGWAIGGWFIPIAQMFLPFLVLNQVTGVGAGEAALKRKRSLLWFWIAFVVLNQLASYALGDILAADAGVQFSGYQLYAGVLAFTIVPLMMARKLFTEIDKDLRGLEPSDHAKAMANTGW